MERIVLSSFVDEGKENGPYKEQIECLYAEEEGLLLAVRKKEREGGIIKDEVAQLEKELAEQYRRVHELSRKGV